MLACAAEEGIVEKSGARYSYNGNRIGQGRENVKNYLNENLEILQELEDAIIKMYIKPVKVNHKEDLSALITDEDGVILEES